MVSLRSASVSRFSSLCRPHHILPRRSYSVGPNPSFNKPRHFLSIADLTPVELTTLLHSSYRVKQALQCGDTLPISLQDGLARQTIALLFTKRSSRTRVSLESATALLGGHPLFLGSNDIQLGVNESLRDTSTMVSSMVGAIFARVDKHEDVVNIAKYSSVPVINALCDRSHPLQILADYLTMMEAFGTASNASPSDAGLRGLKIAWVGDANNVLFDLCLGALKLGVDVSIATPASHPVPHDINELFNTTAKNTGSSAGNITATTKPLEAVKGADVIVTDTWVSMGQEAEKAKRLKEFEGYQVTEQMAKKGGAKEGWKFMHCMPRKPEEVSDDVFYGHRSLVFPEAENRKWTSVGALEGFVVNKGQIVS